MNDPKTPIKLPAARPFQQTYSPNFDDEPEFLPTIFQGGVETLAIVRTPPVIMVDTESVRDGWQQRLAERCPRHLNRFWTRHPDEFKKVRTNDPHAVILGTTDYSAEEIQFKIWPTDYLTVRWLRSLRNRTKPKTEELAPPSVALRFLQGRVLSDRPLEVLSANAIVYSEETRELVVQLRDVVATYPSCYHTLGGAFWPFDDNRGERTLTHTAIREVHEETKGIEISIPEQSPTFLCREVSTGFVQLMCFSQRVSHRTLAFAEGNWEGKIVRVSFDDLQEALRIGMTAVHERKKDIPGGWVPTGLFHILLWLALGVPHATHPPLFRGKTPQKLFRDVTGFSV